MAAEDAERALCLWVNSPANPTGALDDLPAAAAWGRQRGVPVFSDECYAEFTWQGSPQTVLAEGDDGVVAVHSLSKRSNFAGGRAGFYAGDPALVDYLREVRKHVGMMVPGPVQAAAAAALDDDAHVEDQRKRYRGRLDLGRRVFASLGIDCPSPGGGFYLWAPAPAGDAWALVDRVARQLGALVSPGEFYGPAGAGHVRVAMVATEDQVGLLAQRAGVAP
ncbi:MAG: aminotransferase class I/II-fold pyridoxal phosphate-dependent enzyme [Acidimicrobiia bacterium]|nr:aminotransferase class I/II-fold pyridoxal phosphate-dependent enzyme [Acidimicrobiia bacterium]